MLKTWEGIVVTWKLQSVFGIAHCEVGNSGSSAKGIVVPSVQELCRETRVRRFQNKTETIKAKTTAEESSTDSFGEITRTQGHRSCSGASKAALFIKHALRTALTLYVPRMSLNQMNYPNGFYGNPKGKKVSLELKLQSTELCQYSLLEITPIQSNQKSQHWSWSKIHFGRGTRNFADLCWTHLND